MILSFMADHLNVWGVAFVVSAFLCVMFSIRKNPILFKIGTVFAFTAVAASIFTLVSVAVNVFRFFS